jgi:hypothetical protein
MSVLRYVLYTILLMLIETVICIVLFECALLFVKYKVDSWHIEKAVRDGIEVNAIRFIFYYLFYIILFYFLVNAKRWRNRLLQIAVVNCGIYIGLSLLYGLILPGGTDYLRANFFYFLIGATFISPFLLGRKVQQKLVTSS